MGKRICYPEDTIENKLSLLMYCIENNVPFYLFQEGFGRWSTEGTLLYVKVSDDYISDAIIFGFDIGGFTLSNGQGISTMEIDYHE